MSTLLTAAGSVERYEHITFLSERPSGGHGIWGLASDALANFHLTFIANLEKVNQRVTEFHHEQIAAPYMVTVVRPR